MAHYPIDHSETPIRLFKSNFLEFFTHITPTAVLIIWLPFAAYMLARGILLRPAQASGWFLPLAFFIGFFLWTLSEYLLHRFVFHFKPRNPRQERITYLFHGIHHHQPQCKTRLVMPVVVSIPLAVIFYLLFNLVLGALGAAHWAAPMISGFTIGYLTYDLTHYATHHFPMRSGWAKYIKRYHMQHHYKTPDARFGVSSPLWDFVFGTSK
jgi:sterol desaturase/sphingolipid hydroxylase (fatty acid hydroxylase superfamily)